MSDKEGVSSDRTIFIWLIIDAFARWMDRLSPKFPYWLALAIAVLTVVAAFVGIGFIVAGTAADVAKQAPAYESRVSEIFAWVGNVSQYSKTISSG